MLRRGYPIASQREEPPCIGPEKLRQVEMRYIQFEQGNPRWDQWSRFAEVCRTLHSEVQLRGSKHHRRIREYREKKKT